MTLLSASVPLASGSVHAGVAESIASGSLLLAIPLAALAGLLSFASPCVLPLVPGYLSYVTGLTGTGLGASHVAISAVPTIEPSGVGTTRVVLGTSLFVAGFSAVFVSYGALFGGVGAVLLEYQDPLTRILGMVVIVLGLGFIGFIPAMQREVRIHRRPVGGLWGAPLLGALFGLGWTPCIGPTLAAVQGLAFSEASAARGALLALIYCLGLGLPFVVVGLGLERGLRAVSWARRNARAIQILGGVGMLLLGLVMISGAWGGSMNLLRSWVGGWTVPL